MDNNKKKITKRALFSGLLAYAQEHDISTESLTLADIVDGLTHEIALLDKKNVSGGERKPTATQLANTALLDEVLAGMQDGVGYTCSDLIKVIPALAGSSTSKVSSLMNRPLTKGDENRYEKYTEKGKSLFRKI